MTIKIKLVPLGNRVLLRKIETNTRGGLALPPSSEIDEGTQEFEVVEVPFSGAFAEPVGARGAKGEIDGAIAVGIDVGARIYLARHKGWKIETNSGEELYVAEVEDVLALETDNIPPPLKYTREASS